MCYFILYLILRPNCFISKIITIFCRLFKDLFEKQKQNNNNVCQYN